MPWPGNSCPTVPGEPATATEPNEGAFDNPSPWLLFKALGGVRAFEDLDSTSAHASQRAAHFVVGVAAARKDMVQPWIEPLDYRQRLSCTVTVLNAARVQQPSSRNSAMTKASPHRFAIRSSTLSCNVHYWGYAIERAEKHAKRTNGEH